MVNESDLNIQNKNRIFYKQVKSENKTIYNYAKKAFADFSDHTFNTLFEIKVTTQVCATIFLYDKNGAASFPCLLRSLM